MAECRNCGATLTGPYCASCGQQDIDPRPTFGHLLHEATASLFHADSRLWRTMGVLLLRPGRLAQRYVAGQRARFLPPIRLYLATSLLFFMLLSLNGGTPVTVDPVSVSDSHPSALSEAPAVDDSEGLQRIQIPADVRPRIDAARRQVQAAMESKESADDATVEADLSEMLETCDIGYSGLLEDFFRPRIKAACEQARVDHGQVLLSRFRSYLPTAMFLAMPFFALFMKLWFWRPVRYYMEHLLFQLFNHSAFFIVGSLGQTGAMLLPARWSDWLDGGVLVYLFVYAYQSLRTYYQQGRWMTVFKFVSLGGVYLVLMAFGFVFTGLAAVI